MKKILMVGMKDEVGGAEKVMFELYQHTLACSQFQIKLAFIKTSNQPVYYKNSLGLATILFGFADVIHTHLFWPGLLIRVRKLWDPRLNWIHTVHYTDYEGQKWAFVKKFLDRKFIFPKVNKLIFVSPSVQNNYKEFARAQIIINRNKQLPISDKKKSSRTFLLDRPILGCIALFRKEKGVDDLLRAFVLYLNSFPKAKLYLAGDGPEKSTLEKLSADLKLTEAVHFCGFVKDTSFFLEAIDLYVQPSLSESFGLSAFDAITHRKPVVAAAVGHLEQIFKNCANSLVPRDKNFVKNLSDTLVYNTIHFADLKQSLEKNYQAIEADLPAQEYAEKYLNLYKEISQKSVCMVAPIVTHAQGGLQQQLFLQTQELVRRGHRIFILQNKDSRLCDKTSFEFQKRWSHVEFLSVPNGTYAAHQSGKFIGRAKGLWFILYGFFLIARYHREIKITHAHQLYSPTLLGVLAKIFFKIPLVVKVTASGTLGEVAQLKLLPFFPIRRSAFLRIDRIFALTTSMRKEVLELGVNSNQVLVLPNSVEFKKFTLKDHFFAENIFRILFVGRLSKEKSLPTLIKAGALLSKKGYQIKIDIVGAAYEARDDSQDLFKMARNTFPPINIQFWGEQKDVARFYKDTSIFVLPSSSEGMSNALLEAMACGCVCIVSNIPANKYLIQHQENGLLFQQGNAEDLCQKIEECIIDSSQNSILMKKLSKNSSQTIRTQFSTEVIGAKINAVYNELLTQEPR